MQGKIRFSRQNPSSPCNFHSHSARLKSTSIFPLKSWVPGRYEPYYITNRDEPAYELSFLSHIFSFDEVYIGCGYDKISHTLELFIAGFSFYVLPEGFVIHLKHLDTLEEMKHDALVANKSNWCDVEDYVRKPKENSSRSHLSLMQLLNLWNFL